MSSHAVARPMIAHKSGTLTGEAHVSGDKSISHRSLILGALSVGTTTIKGLLEGDDVLDTAKAMRALGATVTQHAAGNWSVDGVGVGGFCEPDTVIDCGNSGTGVRLIMGNGDASNPCNLHRRCQFKQTPNGPHKRSFGAVWRANLWPQRRPFANDHYWRRNPHPRALRSARSIGAGEISGFIGRS